VGFGGYAFDLGTAMFLQSVTILFFLATKWLIGVVLVLPGDRGFWTSVTWCAGGGMLGVVLYTYLGQLFYRIWRRFHPLPKGRVRFTRLKRIIVLVRQRQGLAGIALLTPVLLTVPVGTFAANIIEPDKRLVLSYMAIAFFLWSVGLVGLDSWLNLDLFEWLRSHFGKTT